MDLNGPSAFNVFLRKHSTFNLGATTPVVFWGWAFYVLVVSPFCYGFPAECCPVHRYTSRETRHRLRFFSMGVVISLFMFVLFRCFFSCVLGAPVHRHTSRRNVSTPAVFFGERTFHVLLVFPLLLRFLQRGGTPMHRHMSRATRHQPRCSF